MVKPRVGASGVGVVVVDGPGHAAGAADAARGWSSRWSSRCARVGETSVFVFGGRATSQVDKRPGGDELRVHEAYGGRSVAVPLDQERAALAEHAVAAVGEWFGRAAGVRRIDVMHWEDAWVVSELELIEPGLYLDVDPTPAETFADLLVSLRVGAIPPESLTSELAPASLGGNAPMSEPKTRPAGPIPLDEGGPAGRHQRVDILTP